MSVHDHDDDDDDVPKGKQKKPVPKAATPNLEISPDGKWFLPKENLPTSLPGLYWVALQSTGGKPPVVGIGRFWNKGPGHNTDSEWEPVYPPDLDWAADAVLAWTPIVQFPPLPIVLKLSL